MDSSRQPSVGTGRDDTRVYSPAENEPLAVNLTRIVIALHEGAYDGAEPNADLLCAFHARLFEGVRDHAGKMRRADFGAEYLVFGPNRSHHRSGVSAGIERVTIEARRGIASFDANPDALDYESQGIHLAAWAHAKVIQVHPFEDGNGRTSRLLLNWMLRRIGLLPIAVEVVRQEYFACLNYYFGTGDIQPLVDLLIRLYPLEA